ncbi:uncharacterized protein V6R79_003810 [Siganus canaliculatus]
MPKIICSGVFRYVSIDVTFCRWCRSRCALRESERNLLMCDDRQIFSLSENEDFCHRRDAGSRCTSAEVREWTGRGYHDPA